MTEIVDPGAPESVGPETTIWRYMGLDRYLSLLSSQTLWFTRIDCFEDQWEGHTNEAALGVSGALNIPPETMAPIVEKLRVLMFVHCWSMHPHESVGMWHTFVQSKPGVVVRSTVGRLESVVAAHSDGGHVAKVRYIDYENDLAVDAFNKRREFEGELEVRAAFYDFGQYVDLIQGTDRADLPVGQSVKTSPDELIAEVRVAPGTETWLLAGIREMTEKFEVHAPVRHSELDMTSPGN